MSSSLNPVAYSMAWLAPWLLGWVMVAENLLRPGGQPGATAWRAGASATEAAGGVGDRVDAVPGGRRRGCCIVGRERVRVLCAGRREGKSVDFLIRFPSAPPRASFSRLHRPQEWAKLNLSQSDVADLMGFAATFGGVEGG